MAYEWAGIRKELQMAATDVTKDLYREAMDGIGCKVALQAVRKVIRDNKSSEKAKLEQICIIVHSFEKDMGKEG